MCTGAEILVGSMIVGGVIEGYSKFKGANAEADAQRRQAAIDEKDAQVAEEMAVDSIRRADLEVGKIREGSSRLRATQRYAISAGDIDPTSGSAASVQEGTAILTEYDVSIAKLNGMRTAYGFRSQGLRFRAVADARREAAGSYEMAGYLGAASSLVKLGGLVGMPGPSSVGGAPYWWQATDMAGGAAQT